MRTTVRIRSRDRWLALLAIVGFLVICVAASAGRATHSTPAPAPTLQSVPHTGTVAAPDPSDALEAPPPQRHYHVSVPLHLLARVVVLAAAVGLVALIWLIVGVVPKIRRRPRRPRRGPPVEEAPVELPRSVAEEISRTLSVALAGVNIGDANRSIVACWIRLEQIAEEAGYARQRWETSTELVTRWLAGTRLPSAALDELGALYREARYSDHVMSSGAIERARAALTQLRAAFAVPAAGEPADG